MPSSLENLKNEACTALAEVELCKALEAAFVSWDVKASSSLIIDIVTTTTLVQDIFRLPRLQAEAHGNTDETSDCSELCEECEDEAKGKAVRLVIKR